MQHRLFSAQHVGKFRGSFGLCNIISTHNLQISRSFIFKCVWAAWKMVVGLACWHMIILTGHLFMICWHAWNLVCIVLLWLAPCFHLHKLLFQWIIYYIVASPYIGLLGKGVHWPPIFMYWELILLDIYWRQPICRVEGCGGNPFLLFQCFVRH